jgi:hypothetical protein
MPVDPAPEAPGTQGNLKEDLKAQLLRLKDLTRRTGLIQEAQVVQLRHWPHVLFDIGEHETGLDADNRSITFILQLKAPKATSKDRAACKRLEAWVRSLLGDEWLTSVLVAIPKGKGKKRKLVTSPLFEGTRKQAFEPRPPPGADFKRYDLKDKKAAIDVAAQDLPPIVREKP